MLVGFYTFCRWKEDVFFIYQLLYGHLAHELFPL